MIGGLNEDIVSQIEVELVSIHDAGRYVCDLCPKELAAGDVNEYGRELLAMLRCYNRGEYTVVTDVIM